MIRHEEFEIADAPVLRFLMEPKIQAPYVYIGDIDILVLESGITDIHLKNCRSSGLPYSNIVRVGTKRLSGLHFTKRESYYPITQPPPSILKARLDEEVLYEIVRRRGLELPIGNFRPVHGIHFSPNREKVVADGPDLSWGLTKHFWNKYKDLSCNYHWNFLRTTAFDDRYVQLLNRMVKAGTAAWGLNGG